MAGFGRPRLEVGVGTGRFAQALEVLEGIDPSLPMLRLAAQRNVCARQGRGENLPYDDQSFAVVLMVTVVCFLSEPARVFAEAARVLRPGGRLIVGFIPAGSPWAEGYAHQARQGHPIYRTARFYTPPTMIELARQAGLRCGDARSALHFAPGSLPAGEPDCRPGIAPGAGFVAMAFDKPNCVSSGRPPHGC